MISVGLELTGGAVKVAVVEGSKAKAKLVTFVTRRLDGRGEEDEEDIVTVLKQALKEVKAGKNPLVASVRAQDCMIREISVPAWDDENKIRKAIKFQAEHYFTGLPIDQLIIDYSKFAEEDNRAKLLVTGIKKGHIQRRLELLDEVGIDPLAIDLDVSALYNVHAHLGAFDELGAALLIEIEADTLKVGVIEQGKLRLARGIRMRLGSMRLDPMRKGGGEGKVSGAYPTQIEESARLPVVILDEGDDEAFSLEDSGITEVEREGILHRVFMEIDRTVAAVQLTHEIDRIFLTGSSCVLDGIEQVFSDHFEIDTTRLDIGAELGGKGGLGKGSASLEGGTAVGLALKGLGIDYGGMNFRQEEFGYKGAFTQAKRGVACLLTLLFTFTFLYAYGLKQERGEVKNRTEAVKAMQRHIYTFVFPDPQAELGHEELPVPNNYSSSMMTKRDELSSKYGGGPVGAGQRPTFSALEIMRQFALAKAQVPPRYQIQVMTVAVDPKGQSTFVCRTSEDYGTVMMESKFKHEHLEGKTTRPRPLKEREGSGVQFDFVIQVKEPEGL